jgi:hypothetical protein
VNSMETVTHEAVGTFACITPSVPGMRLLSLTTRAGKREAPPENVLHDDTVLPHSRGTGL